MPKGAVWLGVAACIGCLAGCVERRFVITSDPPGATVLDEHNLSIGAAPADHQFIYYGKYRFTLIKDGYEIMVVEEKVRPPWYEIILLDFFSENVVPWTIRDVRRFHYVLQPRQIVPQEAVLNQANQLRLRGQQIGSPLKAPPEPVPVVAPPPQPVVPPAQPLPGNPPIQPSAPIP